MQRQELVRKRSRMIYYCKGRNHRNQGTIPTLSEKGMWDRNNRTQIIKYGYINLIKWQKSHWNPTNGRILSLKIRPKPIPLFWTLLSFASGNMLKSLVQITPLLEFSILWGFTWIWMFIMDVECNIFWLCALVLTSMMIAPVHNFVTCFGWPARHYIPFAFTKVR
jgi:hypothetical protein